jgi:hypothetical protein
MVEMESQGETWDDFVASEGSIDVEFDANYGIILAQPFTLWTTNRVYFPVGCEGLQWVASVSRHPDGQMTPHVGRS